ncbi:basic proline-rich protein-like [Panicum virgatum]|uniref:basic proline-rich protein-like n=1 Tax=Panicum virgatum TaxID=38727 RepID=UPI0019D61D16|nr:basic proline-rich protein-like [Panicum virgatum]
MGLHQRRLQEGSDANDVVVARPTSGQGFHPEKQRHRDELQDDAPNRGTTPAGAVVIVVGRLSPGESRPCCVPTYRQSTVAFPGLALPSCLPEPRPSCINTLPPHSHPPLPSCRPPRKPPPAAPPWHRRGGHAQATPGRSTTPQPTATRVPHARRRQPQHECCTPATEAAAARGQHPNADPAQGPRAEAAATVARGLAAHSPPPGRQVSGAGAPPSIAVRARPPHGRRSTHRHGRSGHGDGGSGREVAGEDPPTSLARLRDGDLTSYTCFGSQHLLPKSRPPPSLPPTGLPASGSGGGREEDMGGERPPGAGG